MRIDLSNLKELGSYKEINETVEFEEISFRQREIEVPGPFLLSGNIYNAGKEFILNGTLEGKLIFECSRCLEEFTEKIKIELEEEIPREEINNLENVDLTHLLKENILLSIPIKLLCSEDCKGLCPVCGQNLNYEQCDCKKENVDPRLAKLKDYFEK